LAAWSKISIREELAKRVERFVKSHPELGYKSISDFVHEAIRLRLEDLEKEERLRRESESKRGSN
jgi:Arc/MetJ-type ribon-helix-helix transcriptional regulator